MPFNRRILLVDDDPSIRAVSQMLLAARGFDVQTAENGFEALLALRGALPDVIITDLKMPHMSGFELLSVVRKRFPQIPTIAISGEYNGTKPLGLITDVFFTKANYKPEQLFERIAELITASPLRANPSKAEYAPVWLPRSSTGFFVLTCTECLRSFSVPSEDGPNDEVHETECIFCDSPVRYLIERSSDPPPAKKKLREKA
jgi:CheY-like chemotaxis protein